MPEQIPVCKLDLYRQLNLPLPNAPATAQGEQDVGSVRCKRAMGGHEGPICKRDIIKQMGLPIPGDEGMNDMEAVVASMEEEVRTIQNELDEVQGERRQLEMQKRLLHCAAPTVTSGSSKGTDLLSSPPKSPLLKTTENSSQASKPKLVQKVRNDEESELHDLQKQYSQLLKDYNSKLEEVSSLRVEVNEAKRQSLASTRKSEQAEARAEDLEERLKAIEDDGFGEVSNKDKMIELNQQLAMAERMFEKSFQEHEDLVRKITTQTIETDEFRRKYLDAEQAAEEQRHKIGILDRERTRAGEEITLELQNIKVQFQSKLQEMTLLPDMINKTNEKLKDAQQLKTIAEKNCVIISMNLDEALDERDGLQKKLNDISKHKFESEAETSSMKNFLTDGEKKVEEAKNENKNLKLNISRLEEIAIINERKYEEATEEVKHLQEQLETLRQHSARQVSKTKDRFDKTRRTLQDQVAELEKKLATTRALERTALKDRDEIRQKMQAQIIQLNENFDQAQRRIRNIQSHINYLKMSYSSTVGLHED